MELDWEAVCHWTHSFAWWRCRAEGGGSCPVWTAVCPGSFFLSLSPESPALCPLLSQLSSPDCTVDLCLSSCCFLPSKPQHKRGCWPPQTGKTSAAVFCRCWRTPAFSGSTDGSALSCIKCPYFLSSPACLHLQPQIFIGPDHLHIDPLDGHGLEMWFLPSEVHHHILDLGDVQLQMVGPAPPHKFFNQAPLLPLLSILDTANYCSVVQVFLHVAESRVVQRCTGSWMCTQWGGRERAWSLVVLRCCWPQCLTCSPSVWCTVVSRWGSH